MNKENHKKVLWKAGTCLYPLPVVLVSCGNMEKSNIITVAWTGIANTDPAMVYISVRPTRYSYNLIKEQGEFVINLTTKNLVRETDWCGVKTGAKVDKFKEMNLHKEKAKFVQCPLIKESPVSVECKVKQIKELGSHHLFVAEVLSIDADEVLSPELIEEIKVIKERPQYDVYKIKIGDMFPGYTKPAKGAKKYNLERLYNRRYADMPQENQTKDRIEINNRAKIGQLKGVIHHYSYLNLHHQVDKLNNFTDQVVKTAISER